MGSGVWGLGFGVCGTSGAYILERAAARRPPVLGVLRLGISFPVFSFGSVLVRRGKFDLCMRDLAYCWYAMVPASFTKLP